MSEKVLINVFLTGCLASHHRNRIKAFIIIFISAQTFNLRSLNGIKVVQYLGSWPGVLRRSLYCLPWGRSVPSVPRPWETNKGDGLCCPGNKLLPLPVSCIFIGSATKAPAFRRPHSVVISLVTIFFPSHLPVSLFHQDGSLDLTAVWFDLCINDFRVIISCLLCLVGLPLTFLNVQITTGFSFCMIIFYILK